MQKELEKSQDSKFQRTGVKLQNELIQTKNCWPQKKEPSVQVLCEASFFCLLLSLQLCNPLMMISTGIHTYLVCE
jgi:hypothetical protein